VIDAILGALGKGDIGRHFPDSDPMYKGADSLSLLRKVVDILKGEGFMVHNLDATVVAQEPKLARYLEGMGERLSHVLEVDPEAVNVKATTAEGLGFCGRGEGCEAYAVVTLRPR
jgi:2-C-methyl-D-erythritol 2,4-cyclodiphosphate synthase